MSDPNETVETAIFNAIDSFQWGQFHMGVMWRILRASWHYQLARHIAEKLTDEKLVPGPRD